MGLLRTNGTGQEKLLLKIKKLQTKISSLENHEKENKKTIKKLLNSKEMFQQITENTNDNIGITTFDLKATYLYVNPSVKLTLGYLPEEMIGKSFFDFVHPEDKLILLPLLKKYFGMKIKNTIIKPGHPLTEKISYRFKAKNGDWHHLESTVNIIGKELLAVTRDLNTRGTLITALEESEQHYKQLFNSLPYGGEIVNLEGFIVDCSKRTAIMLGYKKEELLGKHITQFVDEDTKESFRINFPKIIKGESIYLESTMIHKNGTPVKVIRAGEPIKDSNGNVSGMLGLSMDITRQKEIDKKLLISNKRFENLFENSPIAIWEEDFRELLKYIAELKARGIDNFENYLSEYPEEIIKCSNMIKIIDVNKAGITLIQAKSKYELLQPLDISATEKSISEFKKEIIAISKGKYELDFDSELLTVSGEKRYIYTKIIIEPEGYNQGIALVSTTDLTEKNLTQIELSNHRQHLEDMVKERTVELEDKNKELERFNKLFVDREFRIKELRDKIKLLEVSK